MKMRHDRCDASRLDLLIEDRLSPAELTRLEDHVERCALCRETLDHQVDSDRWLSVARHRAESGLSAHEVAAEPEDSFPFLAPSDWPDSLGRLGTYEVKGVVGRGGMGVVFKAFDPALNRNVAIKVMPVALAACGASRQRFLREARAAAAVVHEHVVAVYAVDESAGLPYLVMEYVPGLSLQERIDRLGPSSPAEVLRIGMQTAAGLAAAHAQGLVHRDIKPANILLENSVERVRLTDFGLARAAADAGMTHSGVVAGTPHYMSPEQARGETTDHRSDLFSLGSTLYATCAGHPPFRAETPLAVLRRVIDDEPRPLREINPDVPAWLETVIARLMAKDPARRFATAADAALILGGCLAHLQQPLLSPLPPGLENSEKPPVRAQARRVAVAVALAAVAVALGALAYLRPWMTHKFSSDASNAKPLESDPRDLAGTLHDRIGGRELDSLLEQTHHEAEAVEANMLHSGDGPRSDSVSATGFALFQQAEALERSIRSKDVPPAHANDFLPQPVPHNRR
jgi:serine/threonine-protein kinase